MNIKIINKIVNRKSSIVNLKSKIVNIFLVCCLAFSCNFLDIVPDEIPSIDHAFRNRTEAQKYLYGLLGGMPDVGNIAQDPALAGSDEIFGVEYTNIIQVTLMSILRGEQNTVSPYANYWSSRQNNFDLRGGKPLWTTISDCNIFLENIHLPFDLEEPERNKWTGEALFVKAYLHFWLFRQYGPIPLMKENISVDSKILPYREPVDEVVDYIVSLLDLAISLLPLKLEIETEEMGRPDKCIAAALKAQVLSLAASPLFNCNPDYANYGEQLFPQDKSVERLKWKRAADAAKEAIELADEGLHRLYDARIDYPYPGGLSNETLLAMQVRGAATELWNEEIIWGNSRSRTNNNRNLQRFCCPFFSANNNGGSSGLTCWSPSLRIVEQFYTKNGLPIEDDEEWVEKLKYKEENENRWAMRTATAADRQYIRQGNQTIELHFDREARFYASIFFDQGTYFGSNWLTVDNTANAGTLWVAEFMRDKLNGWLFPDRSSRTGYLCKKMLHYRSTSPLTANSFSELLYAFPIIRLADLYLLYAEAMNEWLEKPNKEDVYDYIDFVRDRTGLKGVVASWQEHAVAGKKDLPDSREGMREIIRRERLNELAFEGARYWDLRRWKLAEDYLNRPIRGLDILGKTDDEFYVETELFTPTFEKKDYFSPIIMGVLVSNSNLLQSPYW